MRVLAPKNPELLLDTKDWRVLKELVFNVRQPISQIAKKCLLSRQSVEYRLKLLEKNNLLIGSRSIINIRKLGYSSYHVFIEVHTPEQEKEILHRAQKATYVNAIIIYSGRYNLEISIMARSNEEFLQYYHQLINDVRIRDDHVLVLLDTICAQVLPVKYFPVMKETQPQRFDEIFSKKTVRDTGYTPDHTDLQLLYALSQDARRTNVSIAKVLGISKDTVIYRLRRLEQQGYIVEFRPVVNYSTLGLAINSVLLKLNYSAAGIEKFEQYLRSTGSILWAAKTVGYYNYLLYVITKDLEEFHEVINGIKKNFEGIIKTYEILFAFEELKYSFMAAQIIRT